MAVVASRPSTSSWRPGRVDDTRSLRFRFRLLTFSGSYPTGGEVLTARAVGLNKILGVIPMSGLLGNQANAAGVNPVFNVAANGSQVNIVAGEVGGTGAAGDPFQEKGAEAYIASSTLPVLVVGF